MASQSLEIVLPGDVIKTEGDLDLGPGLRRERHGCVVLQPGVHRFRAPRTHWVDTHCRRYVPVRGQCVVGTVLARAGDIFRVDIGAHEPATLSYLSFEGATKKNRPDVKVGDLVFARLLVANKDMEPELVCVNSKGRAEGLGVLSAEGLDFTVPLHVCRKVLAPACGLLRRLGSELRFEMAVGMNGRVWATSNSLRYTAAVASAICASEHMDEAQIAAMCREVAAVAHQRR
ncbi:exosome complex component RRP40-like isoform X2 [Pollicipes pollicipes]|nr:exosome complex component RRP40-like [Pollicipes pollicipes]XP_037078558.1 exosome complex component RRP40-like isoform X2 [Pollicipes pollicipes]XP_037078559.1 exosome complex component RRP40-like isoform X2 [Pollicipes pollicipes]XP_037078560.1 exosome complex component RRP40-like isoform X2 [Pollicipes pollicipes]XP_037078561.1 exosome complex component RRP40-like isoform X2 [Pollicipes pollicipes]